MNKNKKINIMMAYQTLISFPTLLFSCRIPLASGKLAKTQESCTINH